MIIERRDHVTRLLRGPRIVYHEISTADLVGLGPLSSDPLAGLPFAEAIATAQPLKLLLWVNQHDQGPVNPAFRTGLEKQRGFINDQIVGRLPEVCKAAFGEMSNCWMDDFFKLPTRLRGGEHFTCKDLPVEAPLLRQDDFTKNFGQFSQDRAAGVDNLACQLIGADQGGTAFGKIPCDRAFSGGDPSSKAKNHDAIISCIHSGHAAAHGVVRP